MATKKLSQIAVAGSPPAPTDQLVGVTAGTTDNLFSVAQIQSIAGLPVAGGNLIFYVSTTGNDSTAVVNDITHPWATAQAANNAASRFDYQVTWGATIQFLDGTYSPTASSLVPNSFFNIESGGLTVQGHVGDATKVVLTSQIQVNADVPTVVLIGWLTYNLTSNSCINPQNGSVTVIGDLIFTGTAAPFYIEGVGQLFISAVNITVTSASLNYFIFCAPGVVVVQGGTNIILPASLTVTQGFFNLVGYVDQTSVGVALIQLGTPNWTNFGGVTGPRIAGAAKNGILTLPNGQLTDIPGTSNGVTDGTTVIQNFNWTRTGTRFRTISGYPQPTNLPQQTWQALQDTSGVNTYLAYNNAGAIDLLSARRPKAGANLTFFVATTGSDSNPGTSLLPFATIQFAVNFASIFDYQGLFEPTINVANGTYTLSLAQSIQINLPEMLNTSAADGGNLIGNPGTPTNVVLNDTIGNNTIGATGFNNIWFVNGFQMNSPGGTAFRVFNGAVVEGKNITFNNSSGGAFYLPINVQEYSQFQAAGTITFTNANIGILGIAKVLSGLTFGSLTVNLQPNMTATFEWFDIETFSSLGFAFVTVGNKASSAGKTVVLKAYCSCLTQNGLESDLIGATGTIQGDASSELANIGTLVGGFFANQVAHLPSTSDIVTGAWNLFKDTSGGTVNMAYNDAGTIKKVQLGGLTVTITTAALTGPGTQGSMTFTDGVLTAQTPAT